MNEDYPELKPPSVSESGGAITFEILDRALSTERLQREQQRQEEQIEAALQARQEIYKECLAIAGGNEEEADKIYRGLEADVFRRVYGVSIEEALESAGFI